MIEKIRWRYLCYSIDNFLIAFSLQRNSQNNATETGKEIDKTYLFLLKKDDNP